MAEVPEARANEPRSPSLASTFEIIVPSGMALTGKMFPTVRAAIIIIKVENYTFASSVDEHSCVHAFNGDEILSALLVFVLVSEDDLGEGGTSTSIMNNVSHNSLDITTRQVR